MKRKVIICFFILLLFGMGGWFGMYLADSGVFVKLPMVETKGEAPLLPLGELQKIIISREDHVNMKAQAIFSIFTKYVHVGMGRTDFNVVLPGKGWVDFSDVSMGSIDGGVPEVDCQSGCAQFELRLYSRLQANWWRHLSLS